MIQLIDVSYSVKDGYKERTILENINYTFKESSVTTISGPSGSGKTSLLYAIGGLLENKIDGKVIVNNTKIYDFASKEMAKFRLNNIGIIFQSLNLFPFMSVLDNILVPLYMKNTTINENIYKDIDYYLDYFGLSHIEDIKKQDINALSGGEQQRVAIIRTLIGKQSIILCDEPTGSMDEKNIMLFMDLINKVTQEFKISTLIVTHDQRVIDNSEHKLYLQNGRLEEEGI